MKKEVFLNKFEYKRKGEQKIILNFEPPGNGIKDDLKITGTDFSRAMGFDKKLNDTLVSRLKNEFNTPFKKKFTNTPNKDIFVWAMVIGLRNNIRQNIPVNNIGKNVPIPTFENNLFSYWIGRCICLIEEKDYDVLINKSEIQKIIQEYVNGGLSILHELIFGENKQIEEMKDIVLRFLDDARKAIENLKQEGYLVEKEVD